MSTLEKIKMDGEAVVDKMKRGEPLTEQDKIVYQVYNSLHGGKAGNAGKRKTKTPVQKVK